MRSILALILAIAALALVACGDDDDAGSAAEPAAQQTSDPGKEPTSDPGKEEASGMGGEQDGGGDEERQAPGTEIVVSDSQFGPILFNAQQQAIYLFDKESTSASECYGDCAAAWPPVLTEGEPEAGDGVEAKLLGTTERDDGSLQVTYAGQPLYYYAHEGPGEVKCQNVFGFGGLWLVARPDGTLVR